MKVIRSVVIYGGLALSLLLLVNQNLSSPCDSVIAYELGDLDERFSLSKEEAKKLLGQAEAVWEKEAGKNLFSYEEDAPLKINFIWNPEQERLYAGNKISSALDSQEKDIGTIQDQYQSAMVRYERSLREYETKLKKYEQRVDYWNKQGGAPAEKFKELKEESSVLEKKAKEVNQFRLAVNTLAEQNNASIEKYNSGVQEYNKLFEKEREFDAGNTNGKEINVYRYDGDRELTTLLAHEFGHVLGIEHVDSKDSIMFYLLNEKNQTGRLSLSDKKALSQVCVK